MGHLHRHSDGSAPNFNPMTGNGLFEILSYALSREGWTVQRTPESPMFAALALLDQQWETDYCATIRGGLIDRRGDWSLGASELARLLANLDLGISAITALLPNFPPRLADARDQILANLAHGPDWTRDILWQGSVTMKNVADAIDLFGAATRPTEPVLGTVSGTQVITSSAGVWVNGALHRLVNSTTPGDASFTLVPTDIARIPNPHLAAVQATTVWTKIDANLRAAPTSTTGWHSGASGTTLTAAEVVIVINAVEPDPQALCQKLESQRDSYTYGIVYYAQTIRDNLRYNRAWSTNLSVTTLRTTIAQALGIDFQMHALGQPSQPSGPGAAVAPWLPLWDFSCLMSHPDVDNIADPVMRARARLYIRFPSTSTFCEPELYRLITELRGGIGYIASTVIPAFRASGAGYKADALEAAIADERYWALGGEMEQQLHDGVTAEISQEDLQDIARLANIDFYLTRLDLTPAAGGAGTLSIDMLEGYETTRWGETFFEMADYHPYVLDLRTREGDPVLEALPGNLARPIIANLTAEPPRDWHAALTVEQLIAVAEKMRTVSQSFSMALRPRIGPTRCAMIDANLEASNPWQTGLLRADIEAILSAAGIDFNSKLAKIPEIPRAKIVENIASSAPLWTGLDNSDFLSMNAAGLENEIDLATIQQQISSALYAKIVANVINGNEWCHDLTDPEFVEIIDASGIDEAWLQSPGGDDVLLALLSPAALAIVEANGVAGLPWAAGLQDADLVDIFAARYDNVSPFWGRLLPRLPAGIRIKILANVDEHRVWSQGLDAAEALVVAQTAGVTLTADMAGEVYDDIARIRLDKWENLGYGSENVAAPALWAMAANEKSFALLLGRTIVSSIGWKLAQLEEVNAAIYHTICDSLRSGDRWFAGLSDADIGFLADRSEPYANYMESFAYYDIPTPVLHKIWRNLLQGFIYDNLVMGDAWFAGLSVWQRDRALTFWTEPESSHPDFANRWDWRHDMDAADLLDYLQSRYVDMNFDALDLPDPIDKYYTALAYGATLDPDREPWFLGIATNSPSVAEASSAPCFDEKGLLLDGLPQEEQKEDRMLLGEQFHMDSGLPEWGSSVVPKKPWVRPLQAYKSHDTSHRVTDRQMFYVLPIIEIVLNWVNPILTPSGSMIADGRWIFHTGVASHNYGTGSIILRVSDVPLLSAAS